MVGLVMVGGYSRWTRNEGGYICWKTHSDSDILALLVPHFPLE